MSQLRTELVVYAAGSPDLTGVAIEPVKVGHGFVLFSTPHPAEALAVARAIVARASGTGLSVGDVLVEGGDRFGTPVVEAARLATRAGPGTALASELVVGCLPGAAWSHVGPTELKGLDRPVEAYELSG